MHMHAADAVSINTQCFIEVPHGSVTERQRENFLAGVPCRNCCC